MASSRVQWEKDVALFEKYNIRFIKKGDLEHTPWPAHHLNSFSAIAKLGGTSWIEYRRSSQTAATADDARDWKKSTQERARDLITAVELLRDKQVAELQWRMHIEGRVYKRFELRTKCHSWSCKGRLWRSEIEVVAEEEEDIFDELLRDRVRKRDPCRCSRKKNQIHDTEIDPILTSRAEKQIIYNANTQDLQVRRPDKVYGLLQTPKILQHVGSIDKSFVELSAHRQTKIPEREKIILPFLISEAKSATGKSINSCWEQTAFPVWRLLSLQHDLEKHSGIRMTEQGGPLVWFFANRGSHWQLSGCYTSPDSSRKASYNIHELWNGDVGKLDGALQILLLVDYIFDWAVDLYRPSILQQLEAIAKPSQKEEDEPLDSWAKFWYEKRTTGAYHYRPGNHPGTYFEDLDIIPNTEISIDSEGMFNDSIPPEAAVYERQRRMYSGPPQSRASDQPERGATEDSENSQDDSTTANNTEQPTSPRPTKSSRKEAVEDTLEELLEKERYENKRSKIECLNYWAKFPNLPYYPGPSYIPEIVPPEIYYDKGRLKQLLKEKDKLLKDKLRAKLCEEESWRLLCWTEEWEMGVRQ